ncbi:MAG: phosphodiester glycosidase family protein [Chloroflexota bacterium]|nr:phosphodiester glycosidase family protein [Chloroflexota bacterium]
MIVDIKQKGISFLVTPGNPDADLSLKARTTSQFLEDFNLQVAVNGDGFTPWYDNSIFDYYPHPSDPVEPLGFAASKGTVYSQNTDAEPVLYITRTNRVEFNNPPGKIYNAISGNVMLVDKGKARSLLDESPQPRTAIGLNKNGRYLIIVVVDGRIPGYSEGATLAELSQILIDFGAYSAMNLDGGGSSTLVKEGAYGTSSLLNTPVQNRIPNRQRAVGNHLGIFAKPAND